MADTFPTDNDGNLIPDRHLQLQKTSQQRSADAAKKGNFIKHSLNVARFVGKETLKAFTKTAFAGVAAYMIIPDMAHDINSAVNNLKGAEGKIEEPLRPIARPIQP
jgi:hypothetical protein